MRRSTLLEALHFLDQEEDINKELQFFSYQHFYVIYTTFWKLDLDHDMQLSRVDLARYVVVVVDCPFIFLMWRAVMCSHPA